MEEITASEGYRIVLNIRQEFKDYQKQFIGYFFNEYRHLQQQGEDKFYTFFLIPQRKKQLWARFTIFEDQQDGFSPDKAPFGAIECSATIPPDALLFFIQEIEIYLIQKGLKTLSVTFYPIAYAPESAQLLHHIFLYLKYQIYRTELNYHIPVDHTPFEEKLHHSEKRKLNKLNKAGFQFRQEISAEPKDVYEFVKQARIRKCYPMSLSEEQFLMLSKRFPDEFRVFVVEDQSGAWAALSVVVFINDQILYNFYPADREEYLNYSPTVMLNEGLYQFAQTNQYTILDLGISTELGKLNSGLIRFKKNLGAITSQKLSFYKKLI